MSGIEHFVDGVQEHWAVRPTVPFGTAIAIGDIGRIGKEGEWLPVSTTRARLDVEPTDLRTLRHEKHVWDLTSGKEVSFRTYIEGETSRLVSNVADARARAEISLSSSDSFAFAAQGVEITSAHEMTAVLRAIRHAYHLRAELPDEQRWEQDLAYVFAVADAERLTALIANSAGTEVVVTGGASVGPPKAAADLALGVSVGISSKELQQTNLAPAPRAFYRAYKLNPSIFTKWRDERQTELRGLVAPQPSDPPLVERLDLLPLDAPEKAFVGLDGKPFAASG